MRLSVKHPLPFYRKLLLENKILVLFSFLLAVLGAIVVMAHYWAASRSARLMAVDHVEGVLATSLGPISEAAQAIDRLRLEALLEAAAAREEKIAYLLVCDLEGRPLAASPRSQPAAMLVRTRMSRDEAEPGAGDPVESDYVEAAFPLTVRGRPVGVLQVGVDGEHVREFAVTMVGTVAALALIPILAVLLLARAVVRHAVKPLKELTRVADEISTGNLDPRIDFGVRVNCWEIKECGRTDCRAYMNLIEQCWYVDGTPCEGYESRFPKKLVGCRECKVYQLHRGDEIVQLADAFRHMTNVLKQSREELVKSDDFQKRLIHSSFHGIVATDATDVITIFNEVAEDLIGVSRDEVIGRRDWRAFFEDGLERCMDLPFSHERIRRVRGFPPRESKIRRDDMTFVDVLLSGISLYERGRHLGRVLFFLDMREVKRLREELIRSERMAATGQAAAGISHSIKNILDGFVGGAYVFKRGKEQGDEEGMNTGWEMIERNMDIIASLVKDLLNFAKERRPDYRDVSPAELIGDVVAGLGLEERGRVKVQVEIDRPTRGVPLDPHAFHQCLTNLARNAVEAIPPDREGNVTIRFGVEGEQAVVSVSDDGVGMSHETIEKIKGGMYSTKGSKGTGLGLLVIQKIVKEHMGILTIESREGKGSTFRIEIPAGKGPSIVRDFPGDGDPQEASTGYEKVLSKTKR